MKLKIVLSSLVILTALFLSAFGSPAASQAVKFQDTPVPQPTVVEVTVVPPTVVVVPGTPAAVPVTGANPSTGIWTLVLFGLLGLLAIAFLVAIFSPRTTHDHIDRNPPPPEI